MENKQLKSFKDLQVWQKAVDLASSVYKITESFPNSELYGLTSQMRRAVVSISSNLAEGFKRNHKKEKLQFYNVAYGSDAELESQIEIALKLKFLNGENYQKLDLSVIEISKIIGCLIKSVSKNSPKSYILNSIFFLAIFLYSAFYILYSAQAASAATLYFYPQNLDLFEGENVVVEVRLNTEGEAINALELNGKLSNDNLLITSVDTSSSLVQIFIETPQTDGTNFHLIGGTPGGFSGEGIVGRLNLKAVKTSESTLSFTESLKLLANTEEGKELTVKSLQTNLNVTAKPKDYIELSSRTHPDPLTWYNVKEVNIHWNLEPEAAYSYLVSQDQTAVPDDIPDKPEGDKLWLGDIALNDLTDGIYYFTVKKVGSATVSRYSIFRDTTSPEWINVTLNQGTSETDGKRYESFLAKDSTSGIDRYEAKVDDGNFERVSPPNYVINKTDFQRIIIRAYDKAGNVIEQSIETKKRDYSLWNRNRFKVKIFERRKLSKVESIHNRNQ